MLVIGLLIGALIASALWLFITSKELNNLNKVNTMEIEALKSMYEFDNKKLKGAYTGMMNYINTNKSRLQKWQRIELNNLWNKVLLSLPPGYEDSILCDINWYKFDTLKMAEHKQALIEALDEIRKQDKIDETTLAKVSYHLYFIIYDAGRK